MGDGLATSKEQIQAVADRIAPLPWTSEIAMTVCQQVEEATQVMKNPEAWWWITAILNASGIRRTAVPAIRREIWWQRRSRLMAEKAACRVKWTSSL